MYDIGSMFFFSFQPYRFIFLINYFFLLLSLLIKLGSCEIAFDVRRARRSRSIEGENIRTDGSDKSIGSGKHNFKSKRLPRDTHQIDNGRTNKNYTYGDPLKSTNWTNFVNIAFRECVLTTRYIYISCIVHEQQRSRCTIISLQIKKL